MTAFFYWPYLLLCNRLYMQTLIMMSLVFSFSLRYTIQFRTDERGKALSSAVCQSLFFTTLVAELYLTVSPKAGGEKKKIHRTRLTFGRRKSMYSWNGRLFLSWTFIIPLYIKCSQEELFCKWLLFDSGSGNYNLLNAPWLERKSCFVISQGQDRDIRLLLSHKWHAGHQMN